MDKFDEPIKDARETHEPREGFVDDTMPKVTDQQPTKRRGFHFWVPVAAAAVVVLALIFALLPSTKTVAPGTSKVATTGNSPASTSTSKPQSAALPAATNNAALASDLNSVQGSMNQESADQSSANSTLNDSQQEVTVPTN